MAPKVTEITIKNIKTKKRECFNSYYFSEGKVSFLSSEVIEANKKVLKQGICMKRFKGDIITSELDFMEFEVGDYITVGDSLLEITQVGKPCHSEQCVAYHKEHKCIMQSNVMFAVVSSPGKVSIGDSISK